MTAIHTAQSELFDDVAERLPEGLSFAPDFVSAAEEIALLRVVSALPLHEAKYKEYMAQRRVYAWRTAEDLEASSKPGSTLDTLPAPLVALRERVAAWAGVAVGDFVHVMVSEYPVGAPLGWHRDAPMYELIVGVSLGNPARLRFRPWPPEAPKKADIVALDLAPRSAYVMRGRARWGWQHSLPPVTALRHSITMRTARR